MQSALNILDMLCSITAGYLPHSVLVLRRVETTSSSQLGAQLQAAPVEQFPEKHIAK
jgi:hypothetical protein